MATEICWFGFLFRELGVPLQTAPCIYVDNLSAIHMAANPIFHARTRHIEIDYHFVRELVARKSLHTLYVPSSHQLANVFTKGLSHDQFSLLKYKLNLRVALLRLRGVKRILHQQILSNLSVPSNLLIPLHQPWKSPNNKQRHSLVKMIN
jgi:histone deacetylase 1/2